MLRKLMIAALLAVACVSPAVAHADEEEEIVVTGSRIRMYENWPVPHVFLKRRADFAVVEVTIRNDTRAAEQRLEEMMEAVRLLQQRARPDGITLALVDEDIDIVREFTPPAARGLIQGGGRADTSTLEIRLRTAVRADDTLETIRARVQSFVDETRKPGRVEMSVGSTHLTMVNLEQYREGMLRQIVQEGRALRGIVGAGQGVDIGGLESQVGFHRTGDLEMTLFLQYTLAVRTAAQ